MSADRVLVPLPSGQWLALKPEAFREALEAGSGLIPAPAATGQSDEPLMDAEELGEVLRLPVTWLEQAARENRIPSIQAGRWRRFRRSAVEAALSRSSAA